MGAACERVRGFVAGSMCLVAALAFLVADPRLVRAHGREPSIGQVAFHPRDRATFVLRGTWALLVTRDDGRSFTWTCAVVAGFDRLNEDPPVAITGSGRIALGTFDGLRLSVADGCAYEDAPAPAWGTYAIDVQPDPADARALWVVLSPGDRENVLLRSRDEGASFETVASFPRGVLLEKVRIAPSDTQRIYVTGARPRMGSEPRRVFFFRSADGGLTFESTEIPLLDGERNAHVLAVDPDDAARALVRMTRAVTDERPERLLLTEDGGLTFRTVLEVREIVALAFGHDGSSVWAANWYGGLHRSDDGGSTFSVLDPDLRVRCLAERASASGGSELFVCVDELTNDFAVARSFDRGETLEPLWGFADVTDDVGCDRCTPVGAICPAYWPDVVFDLSVLGGVDGGPPPGPSDTGPRASCEGGIELDGGSADAGRGNGGGCSCSAAGASRLRALVQGLGATLGLWLLRYRRRIRRRLAR